MEADATAEQEKSDGSCEEVSSPSSFSGQNSPSSISGEADADSLTSSMVRQGRRTKRRRKRMLTGVSRQRRAANERERRRIQGVNRAFVELKNTLPVSHLDISKIDILRIATKWIDHLSQLLNKDKREATADNPRTRDLEIFDILGEQFSVDDYELRDNDFTQGEDLWADSFPDLCLHTDEPYLQTLFGSTTNLRTDYLTTPLMEYTDSL